MPDNFAQNGVLEVAVAGAWVIRSGRYGERDQWALDNGVSGGGWKEVPDLTGCAMAFTHPASPSPLRAKP